MPNNSELAAEAILAQVRDLIEETRYQDAIAILESYQVPPADSTLRAIVENNLAVLSILQGNSSPGVGHLRRALEYDSGCAAAMENLALVQQRFGGTFSPDSTRSAKPQVRTPRRTRVAILSLLFSWPSTGGGTVHTAELGRFLGESGYDVQHIYARYDEWGVGKVTQPTGVPSLRLEFDAQSWNQDSIKSAFRHAVQQFQPDFVIVTDSWNSKPLLAEAVDGFRYFLRLAALECLCPLNNVRLLVDAAGQFVSCPKHQLANPDTCQSCVRQNSRLSGQLHQVERGLVEFESSDYSNRLRRAIANAEAVLVVNPLIQSMVAPYAKAVHVVPSGFDPARFPWPWPDQQAADGPSQILFAGLVEEPMKGFHALHAACRLLWQRRQDFQLVATAEPRGFDDEFTRFIGWQSQNDLPRCIRAARMLVFPTVAEEALGRSAVEAMAVGRPVIASRIGGLPFTVTDGVTGLLFEPGNVPELATAIEALLDDPIHCSTLGLAGRRRFESEFSWQSVIQRHYHRILQRPQVDTGLDRRVDLAEHRNNPQPYEPRS